MPPTMAQCYTALKTAVWVLHNDFAELSINPERYTDHETDMRTALTTFDIPFQRAATDALRQYRARRVQTVKSARALLDPVFAQMRRVLDCPENDVPSILSRWYDYSVALATDDTILAAGSTFGTPSSITGTGNAQPVRLTVDRFNYSLDTGAFNETKTFEVETDQSGGVSAGSEVWKWRGDNRGIDLITEDGSGYTGTIQTDSANSGSSKLRNSSFGDFSGTAAVPTEIDGWTPLSSISNFLLNGTTYYRTADTESTPYALQFAASDTLSQAFSVQGIQIPDPDNEPWILSFKWNRNGTTSTLTGHMGAVSSAVSVVAQSGWQHFYLPLTSDAYYRAFKEDALDVKIQAASLSATGLLIDDVYVGPMRRVGPPGRHTWMSIFAGSTDLLRGDYFTAVDSLAKTGVLARWLIDLLGYNHPHLTSGPAILDPT